MTFSQDLQGSRPAAPETLREALRDLISGSGASLAEISAATGVPKTTLHDMAAKERGTVNLEHLKALSAFFHVRPAYLLDPVAYRDSLELSEEERTLVLLFRGLPEGRKGKVKDYLTDQSLLSAAGK